MILAHPRRLAGLAGAAPRRAGRSNHDELGEVGLARRARVSSPFRPFKSPLGRTREAHEIAQKIGPVQSCGAIRKEGQEGGPGLLSETEKSRAIN